MNSEFPSLYARIGPIKIRALVEAFYKLVAQHPELKDIFPTDLSLTIAKQEAFLTGFLGGPPLYQQTYGHPRLRMRHMQFEITPKRAQAWFDCFGMAAKTLDLPEQDLHGLLQAVANTAAALINHQD